MKLVYLVRYVARRGSPSVPVKTTSHEKARALDAMADGTKIKPFAVFKGAHSIP